MHESVINFVNLKIQQQVTEGQKTWLADASSVAHFDSLNMEANENVCYSFIYYFLFVILSYRAKCKISLL